MTFPKYLEVKDSGVEWLGEVPAHWDIFPIKRDLEFLTSGSRGWASHYADDGAAFIRIGNLTRDHIHLDSTDLQRVNVPQGSEGERTKVKTGDVLFSITAYLGSVAVVPDDIETAYVSQHVALARLFKRRLLPGWVAYVTLSDVGKNYLSSQGYGGTKIQLSLEDVADLLVTAPPLCEQASITSFLDHETARIDALVAEQQRLIELLKEKRQAVISHTVTKGLDPDVPMKDSGVEWLGEVPEHWDVVPTGYRYEVQLGRMLNETRSSGDNLRPYLRVFDVQWGVINTQDIPVMDFPPSAQKTYRLEPGDLMVNEGGSYVGRSAIWRGELRECYYQKALHRLRPRWHELDTADYFLYVMEMATQKGVFVANANQTTIDHLTAEQLRSHRFAFPPLGEQKEIARYLKNATIKLERLTKEALGLITLLQERRSALISAAVTGKIDVRDWQPPAGSPAPTEATQTEAV